LQHLQKVAPAAWSGTPLQLPFCAISQSVLRAFQSGATTATSLMKFSKDFSTKSHLCSFLALLLQIIPHAKRIKVVSVIFMLPDGKGNSGGFAFLNRFVVFFLSILPFIAKRLTLILKKYPTQIYETECGDNAPILDHW
jgi:hypothetical protein